MTQPSLHHALMLMGSAMLRVHDPSEEGHGKRTATLVSNLALNLGMPFDFIEILVFCATLHDIGKIAIAEGILNKETLSDSEMEMVRGHPKYSEEIFSALPFLDPRIYPIVRGHHENWDGTGYPDGLVGFFIPEGARILRICDYFDGAVSERPYHAARTDREVIEIMRPESGKSFDPDMFDVFMEMILVK